MNGVGQPERATQNRVVALFRDELGYQALGNWTDRAGNSNIEESLLSAYLGKAGYSKDQIGRAVYLTLWETYMRMAIKARNQRRMALESLAAINPAR